MVGFMGVVMVVAAFKKSWRHPVVFYSFAEKAGWSCSVFSRGFANENTHGFFPVLIVDTIVSIWTIGYWMESGPFSPTQRSSRHPFPPGRKASHSPFCPLKKRLPDSGAGKPLKLVLLLTPLLSLRAKSPLSPTRLIAAAKCWTGLAAIGYLVSLP